MNARQQLRDLARINESHALQIANVEREEARERRGIRKGGSDGQNGQ